MRPVQIKDANADFAKPSNWDDEAFGKCGNLPIRREVMGVAGNAYMAHFSNWKPNADELRVLNAGGVVQLECCGVQPAVSVAVVESAEDAPSLPFPFADIRGAVARGWCADDNANKEMDTVLGEAIAIEIAKMFGPAQPPTGAVETVMGQSRTHSLHCGWPELGCTCRAWESSPLG